MLQTNPDERPTTFEIRDFCRSQQRQGTTASLEFQSSGCYSLEQNTESDDSTLG